MPFHRRVFLGAVAATLVPLRGVAAAPPGKDATPGAGWVTLEARPGSLRLQPEPGAPTSVWTYGGTVPGPVLRIKKGDELKVRLVNALAQPTTLCWHGVRCPNAMDGVGGLTQKVVQPGESFDYRFTPPDAGLFWYHPHAWPHSAEQIERGLYGLLIVDEPTPPPADHELLLVLDDWALDSGNQLPGQVVTPEHAARDGRMGALVTVASVPAPFATSFRPGSRLRLRLLNAAGARIMIAGFEGAHPMVQAIDGQPCEIFEPIRQTIPIGPGARFDIMFDLPSEPGKAARLWLRGEGEPDRLLLVLKAEGESRKPNPPIIAMAQNSALPAAIPLEKALKLTLVIDGGVKPAAPMSKPVAPMSKPPAPVSKPASAKPAPRPEIGGRSAASPPAPSAGDPTHLWTINGIGSDGFSGKPLFTVRRGAAVSLALNNKSAFPQQIHVHGHVVRLLHDLDDGWEPYWRDAVLVAEGRTKHIAFIADNPGRWSLESLVLDRQVTGLAAWFEVT